MGRIYAALREHVLGRGLGKIFFAPTDVILSNITIVQPDIVYVATDRQGAISSRAIEGPPTLVVEILSPSTIQIDRQTKLQIYARYGIPYYWIVDPEARAVDSYALSESTYGLTVRAAGDESLSAPPFGDLVITAATLWR